MSWKVMRQPKTFDSLSRCCWNGKFIKGLSELKQTEH